MKYDPVTQEKEILQFWEKENIREKANTKNLGKKPFYFLDGPPYTSGSIHLGTAWNKTIKDMVTRYKRMQGFEVWDRAGYDMHGLPVENKVQKKLGLKTKEEILTYGLDKFVKDCKAFALKNLYRMNDDFKRIGVWLDFDNAYQTIANEYIEGTWWLVKKAHEKKRLYEGEMTMTWCGSCQTSLAKHELEYKEVTDRSIFVKFKVKGKNEYLIIWTTTPWTIAYNLGIMANPDLEYQKIKVGDEIWILAKELVEKVTQKAEVEYEELETLSGKELEGLEYEHFFGDELKEHYQKIPKKHVVVMSDEYVTTEQGSGLVHMAPGCGGEDYEVGHRNGIKPFNEVDEQGYYTETMGRFSGWHVKKDNEKFITAMEGQGAIVAQENYPHDYGHCWRCKNPILYRTTTQWFFKVEDLVPKMRKLNKEKIRWVPQWAGHNQFDAWLENLRDNGITRQRYWGSPLPVWKCPECEEYVVVESRKELKKLKANKIPDDLHKPWIDEVTLPCKCGSTMKRNPDIMDVWIDAGCDSWASLGFPHDEGLFKKLYPADFITEAKDQIRGWFNLLFVASMLALEDISFKACYMHGYINDAYGQKFSKSLGNYVSPEIVLEKFGADAFRYYVLGASAPGVDMNYNEDDLTLKRRNLEILWNLHKFVMDLAKTIDENPEHLKLQPKEAEEKYILSKLHSTIKKVTEKLDKYHLNEITWDIEELYLELSRTYIQFVREKANNGTDDEQNTVLSTTYEVMKQLIVLMAPITPMMSEIMFRNFKLAFGLKAQSVHLMDWPKVDTKYIDEELESDIETIKDIIKYALAAREKAQTGIRWPLSTLTIETTDKSILGAAKHLEELIKGQINVKHIRYTDAFEGVEVKLLPNYKALGGDFGKDTQKVAKAIEEQSSMTITVDGKQIKLEDKHVQKQRTVPDHIAHAQTQDIAVYLDKRTDDELESEGYAREITRRVQQARKDAGLHKKDTIVLAIKPDKTIEKMIKNHLDDIKDRVNATSISLGTLEDAQHTVKDNVKGHGFEIYIST